MKKIKLSLNPIEEVNPFLFGLHCVAQTPLRLSNIRAFEDFPGLIEDEVQCLRVISLISNCRVEINETGTALSLKPGTLKGGNIVYDSVPRSVNMVKLLCSVLFLGPFCKDSLDLRLVGGITEDEFYNVDLFKAITINLLEKFGLQGASIELEKRGLAPNGGGSIRFFCPNVKTQLQIPKDLSAQVKLLRIRGTIFSLCVSPQLANRVASVCRSHLERFASDVYFGTDCKARSTISTTPASGTNKAIKPSPGFGGAIWVETVKPADVESEHHPPIISLLGVCDFAKVEQSPEDFGKQLAMKFLKEVKRGGNIDTFHQCLLIILMACCPEDVVKAKVGSELSPQCVDTLRIIKRILNVTFKIVRCKEEEEEDDEEEKCAIMLSCLGGGIGNTARKVT